MSVPFGDLAAQHAALAGPLEEAVRAVVASSAFIGGAPVARFEEEFAAWCAAEHAVGCGNGTDAIYIVLKCLGIGPGDEVITTAHSWISTAEVITQTGAQVVFVDVDDYYHLDPALVEAAVTERTRAIIGVHLYGMPFDGPAVAAIAARHGLHLIEDTAQAHGATLDGRPVGSFGAAATFSFYPGKNLGAWGDAGAIITNDADLARNCLVYARHGGAKKHDHEIPGINSRLDGLQAAVLSVKLPHLHGWNSARDRIARRYLEELADVPDLQLPQIRPGATHVWHLFVVRTPHRDALRAHLAASGVASGVHYPRALPFTRAYADLGYTATDLPNASRNQEQILSLPIYAEMTGDQVDEVISAVRSFTA